MKKKLIKIFLLVLFIIIFVVISKTSIVTVNSPSDNLELVMQDQEGVKTKEIKLNQGKNTFLAKKGQTYFIIKNNELSSVLTDRLPGFLFKKSININLKPQSERKIVGNNPYPCMKFYDELYSFSCSGRYVDLKKHVKASENVPSYVLTPSKNYQLWSLYDLFKTSNQVWALSDNNASGIGEDSPNTTLEGKMAFNFSPGLEFLNKKVLPFINSNNLYKSTEYKNGFILYDLENKDVRVFESIESQPPSLAIGDDINGLNATNLSVNGDKISFGFSSEVEDDIDDIEGESKTEKTTKGTTVLKIFEKNETKNLKFNFGSRESSACGSHYVCVLSNKLLFVYDTGNINKPAMSIPGVEKFITMGDKILLKQDFGVVIFDLNTKNGYIAFSATSEGICSGLNKVNEDQFLICSSQKNGDNIGLLINISRESDEIDKKINNLSDLSEIDTISTYNNNIFITLSKSKKTFDEKLGIYISNIDQLNNDKEKVKNKARELGISEDNYKIKFF